MRLNHISDIDEECRGPLLAMVFDDKAETGGRTGAQCTLSIGCVDFDADLVASERLEADRLQHVNAIHGPPDRRLPMDRFKNTAGRRRRHHVIRDAFHLHLWAREAGPLTPDVQSDAVRHVSSLLRLMRLRSLPATGNKGR